LVPDPDDFPSHRNPTDFAGREGAAPGDYEWEIQRLDAAVSDQTGRPKP
jgi:hypothetical protein